MFEGVESWLLWAEHDIRSAFPGANRDHISSVTGKIYTELLESNYDTY